MNHNGGMAGFVPVAEYFRVSNVAEEFNAHNNQLIAQVEELQTEIKDLQSQVVKLESKLTPKVPVGTRKKDDKAPSSSE